MHFNDLYEKKEHGSHAFPIQYYRIGYEHPQYQMALHWHKEFEIIRILSGEFSLFLNNTEYRLSAGNIMLFDGGTLHRGVPYNCEYECIVFDLTMLIKNRDDSVSPTIFQLIKGKFSARNLFTQNEQLLYYCFCSLFDCMKNEIPFYEFDVYGKLYQIFGILYRENHITPVHEDSRRGHGQSAITELVDWIDIHFTEAITLDKLSEISGFNKKYLCRIFKQYTHSTPINYINSLRIENACLMMNNKNYNITEAAIENGFNDLSYFSRVFKKIKGITPRQYKNQYHKGE